MKNQREAIMDHMIYPSRIDATIANKVSEAICNQVDKIRFEIAKDVYHILRRLAEQHYEQSG